MNANDKVNILMVDDQPAKLLSYEAILGELGENLIKALSGREALEILLKTDVAVVLMDVSMPEMDGFEMAEIIRQHPRFQKTAIIFISAVHLTDLDKLKGYQRGAVDYISVPVVPEVLRAKVSVFAELHRKRRELEALNRDLEARVLARTEELQESETQFRTLANSIPQLAWMADHDGRVFWYNQRWCDYTGTTLEGIQGSGWHKLHHPEHVERVVKGLERSWATGDPWEDTFPLLGQDGEYRWFLSRAVPVFDSHGKISRWFGTCTDISRQMVAEEALRKNERLAAMGRVAAIIAHEINNPLEAITNAFYLLEGHPSLDEEARSYARMASEELARISHITKQSLSFYRESQQAVPVSLATVLDDVLELQARHFKINGIEVAKEYTSSGLIYAYPAELKQVFLNLVGNALQAMPGGGRMRVSVRETAERGRVPRGIRISVCDTGSGIRPEDAKRLFEPFFTTKATKGTGLGLWISKGIVQKYDGTIRFRSLRMSNRTTTCFSVFIPGTVTMHRSGSAVFSGA
ncbi:MAG TPA: ATP-binding protein [Candidatus Angelobacter sp.]|jgi:PAS domain S-box-containing protein|nr:ATP-binding protein [Candidatus Angelobacter sp.]